LWQIVVGSTLFTLRHMREGNGSVLQIISVTVNTIIISFQKVGKYV